MAKFCTYCGKPLPESGVCDCELSAAARAAAAEPVQAGPQEPAAAPEPVRAEPAGQAVPAAEPAAAASQEPAAAAQSAGEARAAAAAAAVAENVYVKKTKAAVSQSVPFVKDYWKEPMNATLRVLREKNMALSVVMMVVNALVSGLFLFTCLSKLGSGARDVLKELSSLFGSDRVDVSVPFFTSLLLGILIAVVVLALSALALFVLLKILKVNASIQYVIMAVGVNSVPCTACLVLALLCALFGWATPAALFLLLGAVAWVTLGALLMTKVFGARVSGLMLTLTTVFFAVVLALSCWIGGRLSLSAVGQVEVDDTKLKEAVEEFEDQLADLDLNDLLGSLMRSSMYGF